MFSLVPRFTTSPTPSQPRRTRHFLGEKASLKLVVLGRITLRLESDYEMPTASFNWDFAWFVVFWGATPRGRAHKALPKAAQLCS